MLADFKLLKYDSPFSVVDKSVVYCKFFKIRSTSETALFRWS